ncbi:hypothetical protein NA8A_02815 [Nitratireductor indicus C115]|uniref:Uncharacterized protein n=1 Tax=Nitratireductor indicus C115 TaxID=1231190 RepID=K2P0J9_9HYPH|nr:hypothetical protein NA8A_02815 [Nitratireductor indicus C115]
MCEQSGGGIIPAIIHASGIIIKSIQQTLCIAAKIGSIFLMPCALYNSIKRGIVPVEPGEQCILAEKSAYFPGYSRWRTSSRRQLNRMRKFVRHREKVTCSALIATADESKSSRSSVIGEWLRLFTRQIEKATWRRALYPLYDMCEPRD